MITSWKVYNFKSIRDETELTLSPLTIFAGANSSGKSTFIQSILLITQTLANKVSSRSVVLNGSLTSLGQFDDLKSSGSSADQIVIRCTCRPLLDGDGSALAMAPTRTAKGALYYAARARRPLEISCELAFDAPPSSLQQDVFQLQPRLFSTQIDCTLPGESGSEQRATLILRHSSKALSEIAGIQGEQELDDGLRVALGFDVDIDEASIADVKEDFRSAHPIGCFLRHFLPIRVVYTIDPIQEDARTIAAALQSDRPFLSSRVGVRSRPSREIVLTESILSVLRDILEQKGVGYDQIFALTFAHQPELEGGEKSIPFSLWSERFRALARESRITIQQTLQESDDLCDRIYKALKSEGTTGTSRTVVTLPPPPPINEGARYLESFFSSSVKYLGPLRDAPKPLYPLAPAAEPDDVGLRGEHTASVLELHKNRQVRYIPSSQFRSPAIERRIVTRTLATAVVDWLLYLGIASSVVSKDMGKLGHELKVALGNSKETHDLTHVGVGVSQVLPILVMCLLAEADSTLVFEQPELHLHPKVQTLLGDFFLSMSLCNKQCIVETHSEYLIDRLRFRIAAANEPPLADQAKIYFVEKPDAASHFRNVAINEYGAVVDWPEGFFDQSQQQAEEILRAAARKRKSNRDRGNG